MAIEFDKQIRQTIEGNSMVFCYANHFEKAIDFCAKNRIYELQIRSRLGEEPLQKPLDFSLFEKLTDSLHVISFQNETKDFEIINFESIYKLDKLKEIFISNKQRFSLDFNKFKHLEHLGCIYWNGVSNFHESKSLKSIVFSKQYPFDNLTIFSHLKTLETLHIYFSKLASLDGIENIPSLKNIFFARCRDLTDISALGKCKKLETVILEKLKNIEDLSALNELKSIGTKVNLINVKTKE